MNFKVLRRASHSRVTVSGTVEGYHVKLVRESVTRLIDQGFTNLVIDMSEADDALPMAALCALAELLAACRLREGVPVVVAPGPSMHGMLVRTGLESVVNVVPTAERALPCLLARMRKRYDQAFFRLILEREVVDRDQLREVVDLYRASGEKKPFGDILMEKGYLTLEPLLDLLAVAMQTAPADLADDGASPSGTGPAAAGLAPGRATPAPASPSSGSDDDFDPFADLAEAFVRHPAPSAPSPAAPKAAKPVPHAGPAEDPTPPSEFIRPSLLGQILVEHGFITAGQLREALDVQRSREGSRLGDILIECGFIANEDIFAALQSQCRRRGPDDEEPAAETFQKRPAPPPSEFIRKSLFGEILLELGLVTEAQLREALELQRDDPEGRQLGDILVAIGAVTPSQILAALEEQANRKG